MTISPSKPSSPRSSPERIGLLIDAGASSRAGTSRWPGHHRLDAGVDRCTEGQQRCVEVAADDRQLPVRVGRGVAVPGEVLRTGRYALALGAGDERGDVPRDELGIGAEAAHADDGIQGVGVRVGDRGEVQVDADAQASSPAIAPATSSVSSTSSTAPSARLPGYELPCSASSRVTSPPSSSIEISSSGRSARSAPVSSRELLGIADVVGEERDPAEPSLEPARHPVRDDVTREARLEAGRSEAVELAHCLTAPAVRPKAIRLCTSTKKSTTGRAVSVAAAISVPQSTPRVVPVVKFASQIVIVCLSALESRT